MRIVAGFQCRHHFNSLLLVGGLIGKFVANDEDVITESPIKPDCIHEYKFLGESLIDSLGGYELTIFQPSLHYLANISCMQMTAAGS